MKNPDRTIAELLTPVKSAKRLIKDGPRLLMCGDGKMRRIPPPKSPESLSNYLRLRSKSENRGYKTPCQVWIGCIDGGYGGLWVNGRARKVHQLSWLLNCGPIPCGLFVCHHCDQPDCFRADHLFVGTHRQNVDDCKNKGRYQLFAQARIGKRKLIGGKLEEFKSRIEAGDHPSRIASEYGIGVTTACKMAKEIFGK